MILCGGKGSRLWPISTERRPKPFLPLTSRESMLRETAMRLREAGGELQFARLTVVGAARHERLLRNELPEASLILEPMSRDSAPAVAAACVSRDGGDLLLMLPADHHVADVGAFHRALAAGTGRALAGEIVTFGITPDRPATGYGYIRAGAPSGELEPAPVASFTEKPDRETAERYLAEGCYFWNAGIFLFTVDTMLAAFERHAPDILASVRRAYRAAGQGDGPARLDPAAFSECRAQSIDYAVMEKETGVSMVPVDMGWTDIGDYAALYRLKAAGRSENVCEGAAMARESRGCFIRSEGPMVAVRGLTDVAVAATPRGVLVTPLAEAGSTKSLAEDAARFGFAVSIDPGTIARVREWLFKSCLPLWAATAWDARRGGFVEALDLAGRPLDTLERRGRVLPRQIYAFSHALLLGWEDKRATDLVCMGLDYLDTRARHPGGGWAGLLSPDGEALSDVRTLYDHAFVVLGSAYAFMATGDTRARDMAHEALNFIEERLRDPRCGGFFDGEPHGQVRRSNPHMHLLEACLAMHMATGENRHLDLAREVVFLFEEKFFDSRSGALTETFAADWSRAPGEAGDLVEPGHCYEWAVLLGFFEEEEGRDLISWRRRLIGFADRVGQDEHGFALDAVDRQARVMRGSRRLWPQLEMFRARLFHPDTAPPGEAGRVLERILDSYLARGPVGGWVDMFDADGRPAAKTVPASMLYHMLTAFSPLIFPGR